MIWFRFHVHGLVDGVLDMKGVGGRIRTLVWRIWLAEQTMLASDFSSHTRMVLALCAAESSA